MMEPDFRQWATRYAPVFQFDSREKYMPSSIPWMIARSALNYKGVQIVKPGALTPDRLYEEQFKPEPVEKKPNEDDAEDEISTGSVDANAKQRDRNLLALDIPKEIWEGVTVSDLPSVEIYAKIEVFTRDDLVRIKYAVFYPYNGPTKVLGLVKAGAHQSDLENVIIDFEQSSGRPTRVYLSAHRGGKWHPWHEMTFYGKLNDDNAWRPIVYVARNSHAMYHTAGCVPRIGFTVWDKCDGRGYLWQVAKVQEVTDKSPIWNQYNGRLGSPSEGRMPQFKSWWKPDAWPTRNDTFCSRLCCP